MTANVSTLSNKIVNTDAKNRKATIHEQKNTMVPQFKMLLNGDNDKAERAFRIAVTEYNKNPNLKECDISSFWGSVINAVQMNLEPGPLGHAYLVPYKGQVSLQLGYKGILELVNRSGKVDSVYAYPVYNTDFFDFTLGTDVKIIHTPDINSDLNDANIVCFYAVAILKGSSIPRVEVMTKKQVDFVKGKSNASKYGPWVEFYSEMGRKTVLKRLCKTLPLSVETQIAISKDESIRKNISTAAGIEIDDSQPIYNIQEDTIETEVYNGLQSNS